MTKLIKGKITKEFIDGFIKGLGHCDYEGVIFIYYTHPNLIEDRLMRELSFICRNVGKINLIYQIATYQKNSKIRFLITDMAPIDSVSIIPVGHKCDMVSFSKYISCNYNEDDKIQFIEAEETTKK